MNTEFVLTWFGHNWPKVLQSWQHLNGDYWFKKTPIKTTTTKNPILPPPQTKSVSIHSNTQSFVWQAPVSLCPLPSSLLLPHAARRPVLNCCCNQCDSYCLINMRVVHTIFPHVSSLMHSFRPVPLLSPSPYFPFYLSIHCHFPLFSHISILLFHPLTWPPPPSCSLITHKLTLKPSIIAYVKTHTNAHSAAYLTALILFPCPVSPTPLIHIVFMLNDWCLTIPHFPLH